MQSLKRTLRKIITNGKRENYYHWIHKHTYINVCLYTFVCMSKLFLFQVISISWKQSQNSLKFPLYIFLLNATNFFLSVQTVFQWNIIHWIKKILTCTYPEPTSRSLSNLLKGSSGLHICLIWLITSSEFRFGSSRFRSIVLVPLLSSSFGEGELPFFTPSTTIGCKMSKSRTTWKV